MTVPSSLTELAAAAAAVITILTLLALIVRGLKFILTLPSQIKSYFFKPKYIIIPTADELARYCEKSFDSKRPTLNEMFEEYNHRYSKLRRKFIEVSQYRILLISIPFCISFSILFGRIWYFVLLARGDTERPTLDSLFITLFAISIIGYVAIAYRVFFSSDLTKRKAARNMVKRFSRSFGRDF